MSAPFRVFPYWTSKLRVRKDFDNLLERMEKRLYRDSLPVLGWYWLRTIYRSGYDRRELEALDGLIGRAQTTGGEQSAILAEMKHWIRQTPAAGKTGREEGQSAAPDRSRLRSANIERYLAQLLNQWLPAEIARLLVTEFEEDGVFSTGIPALIRGRAIERLLIREHVSRETLEALLDPGLLSPQWFYPADIEILRDVVLYLLGRTEMPPFPALPAVLIAVAPESPLDSSQHGDAVRHGFLVEAAGGEEFHVPIAPGDAAKLLDRDSLRIGAVIVSMDGRWWNANRLQRSDRDVIVYEPGGHLCIDYSEEHARLRIPWPESRPQWRGAVRLETKFELLGRRWRIAQWEQEGAHTWLHLVFADSIRMPEPRSETENGVRRLRPAVADMRWAALEDALLAALAQETADPIEQFRHSELIPLGRALLGLCEATRGGRPRNLETVESRVNAVRYHSAELREFLGPVPWRILPEPVRKVLLSARDYSQLDCLVNATFDGVPERRTASRDSHAA
ncbi:MAG: hypothetical protein C5B51_11195 [Terriglobia bacterium]|nr:MAG: hypothetical protein C5B51_11195 [Terriglobia bacterium]